MPWAKERGLGTDMAELCASEHVRDAVAKSMAEEARVAQLRGFEQVCMRVHVCTWGCVFVGCFYMRVCFTV